MVSVFWVLTHGGAGLLIADVLEKHTAFNLNGQGILKKLF
jgi:hypothetical protein